MSGRIGAVIAIAAATALAVAAPAGATVDCTFDGPSDLLQVDLTASGDEAQLDVSGGTIRVFDETVDVALVACSGGTATVNNTDSVFVIDGSDLPGGAAQDGNTSVTIVGPTDFAPGEDAEVGRPANIEFVLNPNNGTEDRLVLFGTEGPDAWELGKTGINWNPLADVGSPDSEMVLSNPTLYDQVDTYTSGDDDAISARGGIATGAPLDGSGPELSLIGGPDSDLINGGDGDDFLGGDEGTDTMRGFAGNDTFRGFAGTDTYAGGAGSDTAAFTSDPDGVNVDLGIAGAQDTGEGSDTLTSIENLRGSSSGDTLIGTDGPNTIEGGDGADTVEGRGGADALDGADIGFPDQETDTVTYAGAPAGVTANLTTGAASGGAGTDTLTAFENLTGSPFADNLTGNGLANTITGLGGLDTIAALGGPDAVNVRDGEADVASCGADVDSATADEATVDSVDPDCETVDFPPGPGGAGAGGDGGGAESLADRDVDFDLAGKAKQRVLKQKGVVVTASCPLEDCAADFAGKVKPRSEELAAGAAEKLTLKLKRKRLRAIARALRNGRQPTVKVTASVSDAAGNVAAAEVAVRAKR